MGSCFPPLSYDLLVAHLETNGEHAIHADGRESLERDTDRDDTSDIDDNRHELAHVRVPFSSRH